MEMGSLGLMPGGISGPRAIRVRTSNVGVGGVFVTRQPDPSARNPQRYWTVVVPWIDVLCSAVIAPNQQ